MAAVVSVINSNSADLDPIVSVAGVEYLKEALVPRSASGQDELVAAQRIATHADDAAFTPATDGVVVMAAEADETATDSVDEGDAGALRMTLNRRLITAGQFLDDAAYTPATDYSTVIGAMADETSPDSVNEGDSGALRMTLARNLHVVNVADVATLSQVNSLATSATILAANANRIGAAFFNTDANGLYLKFGATATATSFTVLIPANGYYELPNPVYRGIIDGIWAADGAGLVAVTELT